MLHNFSNIGFLEEPKGLEEFLLNQGYRMEESQSDKTCKTYVQEEELNPILYHFPEAVGKERFHEIPIPDWKKAGFDIVSELAIDCCYDDATAMEEEIRLFQEILKKYKGVRYDSDSDMFLTSKDVKSE